MSVMSLEWGVFEPMISKMALSFFYLFCSQKTIGRSKKIFFNVSKPRKSYRIIKGCPSLGTWIQRIDHSATDHQKGSQLSKIQTTTAHESAGWHFEQSNSKRKNKTNFKTQTFKLFPKVVSLPFQAMTVFFHHQDDNSNLSANVKSGSSQPAPKQISPKKSPKQRSPVKRIAPPENTYPYFTGDQRKDI